MHTKSIRTPQWQISSLFSKISDLWSFLNSDTPVIPSTIFHSSIFLLRRCSFSIMSAGLVPPVTSPLCRLSILDLRRCARARCHLPGFLFLLDDPLYLARRKSVANLSSSCTTWPHCEPVQWSRGAISNSKVSSGEFERKDVSFCSFFSFFFFFLIYMLYERQLYVSGTCLLILTKKYLKDSKYFFFFSKERKI